MAEMTEEEIFECQMKFCGGDTNTDSCLSLDELVPVIRSMGWLEDDFSDEDIKKWFAKIDTDNNKTVSYNEFLVIYRKLQVTDRKVARLRMIFGEMDSDKSGRLSEAEVKQGLAKAGYHWPDDSIKEFMTRMGKGDGKLSTKEFIDFFVGSPFFEN